MGTTAPANPVWNMPQPAKDHRRDTALAILSIVSEMNSSALSGKHLTLGTLGLHLRDKPSTSAGSWIGAGSNVTLMPPQFTGEALDRARLLPVKLSASRNVPGEPKPLSPSLTRVDLRHIEWIVRCGIRRNRA